MESGDKYFATTLHQTLAALQGDAPAAHNRIVRELADISVSIEIEHESFQLSSTGERIVFEANKPSDVSVCANALTILDLIEGKRDMLECVLTGDLDLSAPVDALPNLARASTAFSEGAIRSRNMRALLNSFRQAVLAKYRRDC